MRYCRPGERRARVLLQFTKPKGNNRLLVEYICLMRINVLMNQTSPFFYPLYLPISLFSINFTYLHQHSSFRISNHLLVENLITFFLGVFFIELFFFLILLSASVQPTGRCGKKIFFLK